MGEPEAETEGMFVFHALRRIGKYAVAREAAPQRASVLTLE
jgi:hypothetical protein